MSRVTFLDNNFNGKYGKFFTGLYNRNKKLLILSVSIYFLLLIIGVLIGYFFPDFIEHFLTSLINQLQGMNIKIDTFSVFLHNLRSIFVTYVGGNNWSNSSNSISL